MAIASGLALQKAMLSKLAADPSVAALLGGSAVYDDVPQGTRPPYVSFGDIATRDWSTKDARAEEHFATLLVWSRERGRKQAYEIIAAIDAALDGAALVLDGHRLVSLSTTFWTVARDGENYRGIVRLRAATERASG